MGKVEDVGGVVTQGVGVGKKFSAAFGGQKFTTPLGPGSNVVRGVVRQNFRLKGGGPTPHHPPLAHV